MGALTSKPFAFTARSWELKSIKSINLFDGEGVSIKFNIRNNEILRILPTFDSYLNNEWINDKTRFNYDGINKNRLKNVEIRNTGLENAFRKSVNRIINLKGKKLEWDMTLQLLNNYFDIKADCLIPIVSGEIDLNTLFATKKLLASIGSLNLMFETDKNSGYINLTNNYKSRILNCLPFENNNNLLSTLSDNVDKRLIFGDIFVLIGSNPRFESPILFAKILKQLNSNQNKKIILFNSVFPVNSNIANSIVNLGNDLINFKKFIQGRIKQSIYMANAKFPLFIIGDIADKNYKSYLEETMLALYNKQIERNSDKYQNYNPFIFIKNNVNSAAFSLLFSSNYSNSSLNKKFNQANLAKSLNQNINKKYGLILLGDFAKPLHIIGDLIVSKQIKFVIHQKSFLNSVISVDNSILQLPQFYGTEARLSFINQFFKKQKSEISAVTFGKERKGWHIIKILSELWANPINYETENMLIKEMEKLEPLISDKNGIKNEIIDNKLDGRDDLNAVKKISNKIQYKNFNIWNQQIKNNVHEFFTSDSVSSNSAPMALAQKRREILDFNNFNYKY
jgi:NADH-quinone oxidoreductase subunit G